MNNLKYLNLNSNQLVDFKEAQMSQSPNIKTLEIEGNQLKFDTLSDLMEFIEYLKELLLLERLDIDENPFFIAKNQFHGVNIRQKIIEELSMLKFFNGEPIKVVKEQINLHIQIEKEEHGDHCDSEAHREAMMKHNIVQDIKA